MDTLKQLIAEFPEEWKVMYEAIQKRYPQITRIDDLSIEQLDKIILNIEAKKKESER